MVEQFDDLRPYRDEEIMPAMNRIADNPYFLPLMSWLYTGDILLEKMKEIRRIRSVRDFQLKIMDSAVKSIVRKTMDGFTCHGLDRLDARQPYLFISNHRDIVLDSALLQIALVEKGFNTTQITFGSNLMQGEMAIDIGKSNKMFKVIRGGNPRDLYQHSVHLSRYIRHVLVEKKESVWIAQRGGRTKDGCDLTDPAVLKMLALSGGTNKRENIAQLNIVPVAISYQYEPCDHLKARELYLSQDQKYIKAPGEDFGSIITGITEPKGKVHIEVSAPLTEEELRELEQLDRSDIFNEVARLTDNRIYKGYKLWDTNYIAYDMLYNTFEYTNRYRLDDYRAFASRMHKRLAYFDRGNMDLMNIFLKIYANPVHNQNEF